MSKGLPEKIVQLLAASRKSPETFAGMMKVFGPLPEVAKCDLANRLVMAAEVYKLTRRASYLPTPGDEIKRILAIGKAAKQLLAKLGIDDPQSVAFTPLAHGMGTLHPVVSKQLSIALFRVAAVRRPATATLGADERIATLLLLLSDLVQATVRAASKETAQRSARRLLRPSKALANQSSPHQGAGSPKRDSRDTKKASRGGNMREPTAETDLIQSLIEVYAALCEQFPQYEHEVAFDQSLLRFVRAGLRFVVTSADSPSGDDTLYESPDMALVDCNLANPERITDKAISDVFYRWRPQTKSK